ncbi:MAG TPA: hypothetical protein VKI19_15035 [Acidimicrobiales bacterium]|nr:hypothetical protein [Acidimicrobiales bacterium]
MILLAGGSLAYVTSRGDSKGHLPPEETISSYRIVYQITAYQSPTSTEEIDVQRPYLGREVQRTAGKIVSGLITNDQGLWRWAGSGWSQVGGGERPSAGDYDLIPPLMAAIEGGDARVIGHSRVLGRTCTIVRTGSPPASQLAAPSAHSYDDICVDRTGIELSDTWVLNGTLLRTRTATTFAPDAASVEDAFTPSPTRPAAVQSGLPAASEALQPSAFSGLPFPFDPPPGFRPDGGYLTIPLQNGTIAGPPSYTENFRNGSRLIELVEGSQPSPFIPQGRPVHSPLGVAALDVQLSGSQFQIALPEDQFALITGSDPSLLLVAARGLRSSQAG